jgi:hypothetical protein
MAMSSATKYRAVNNSVMAGAYSAAAINDANQRPNNHLKEKNRSGKTSRWQQQCGECDGNKHVGGVWRFSGEKKLCNYGDGHGAMA